MSRLSTSNLKPFGIKPWTFSWREYWQIIKYLFAKLQRDNVTVVAAGVAFYSVLAIFPLITALISIFGFIADPVAVQAQLQKFSDILPPQAWKIVNDQIMAVVNAPAPTLGLGIVISLLLTLWSAGSGIRAMMRAMNIAYGEDENRNFFRFSIEGLLFTLAIGVFMTLAFYVIIYIPTLLNFMHFSEAAERISISLPWIILVVYFGLATVLLYRFGPSRHAAPFTWLLPGAIFATLSWLIISYGFTRFVDDFGTYNRIYGSLSAVIVLMMWLWLTTLVIIIGAEINSEFELAALAKMEKLRPMQESATPTPTQ